jgi:hypothetical protein
LFFESVTALGRAAASRARAHDESGRRVKRGSVARSPVVLAPHQRGADFFRQDCGEMICAIRRIPRITTAASR